MTRLEIGELYYTQGGVLGRRFLGSTLWMAQQIIQGGYPTPTQAQTNWANAVVAADAVEPFAARAFKWALVNNATLQANGNATEDTDLDYCVAEYAKTYVA